MERNIINNYMYSLCYQILTIILPLITLPYLSRVLGAIGIGTYSYVVAIAAYFILFGTLGINLYGQREIAYVQDDKKSRSKIFFEIFIMKSVALTFSLIIFILTFATYGEYTSCFIKSLYWKLLRIF